MNEAHNASTGVFRTDKLPSLSRIPRELGREERWCEACGKTTTHILYQVPKRVAFLYFRDHAENVHATCMECARSEVLTGEARERALSAADHGSRTG